MNSKGRFEQRLTNAGILLRSDNGAPLTEPSSSIGADKERENEERESEGLGFCDEREGDEMRGEKRF